MERILRLTAAADPAAAEKLLGTPESPQQVGILAIVGDRGLAGSYNSGVLRATERLVAEHAARRGRGDGCGRWARRRRRTSATAGIDGRAVVRRHRRPARVRRRPGHRRRRGRPVRGRRDRPGADGVDPVHLGRHPAGRDAADAAAAPCPTTGDEAERRRRPAEAETASRATPSSSPSPRSCWPSWPRALEAEIFAALLEGAASFFTAQQRAMAAATDNADELSAP